MGDMHLTRRGFHALLLASAASAALPRAAFASPGNADEVFLNRLTFGANPAARAELAAMGRAAWLDAQLAAPASDPALDARLADARLRLSYEAGEDENGKWPARDEMLPLASLTSDPATRVDLINFGTPMDYGVRVRPANEVIAASLTRAVHAEGQLREVMTQFWHNHFHVNAMKDETTAVFFPEYDRVMRDNALGNFRTLLEAVAQSPAMLNYLNNADSRASPANENFARELLELHTLGADNYVNDLHPDWRQVPLNDQGIASGYIDQDVYEVARALTGWSIGDGRWISDGVEAPRTGLFNYVEAWHDPYQKRVLGVEFAPNRAPLEDARQVMDMLATHPGTARFVSRKMVRRLLTDDPDPAMVDRIAAVFLQHAAEPDQIARVVRAIVEDPLFDQTPPGKFRRPFEFLAAIYRATGADVWSSEMGFDWQLQQAGWRQHTYGPPTGHPDRADRWAAATVMARTVDYALYAHEEWFGCTATRLGGDKPWTGSFADLVTEWRGRLLGPGDSDDLAVLAEGLGVTDPQAPMALSPDDHQHIATMTVAFAAVSPAFILR
jgi:uncharacterized protein (DUF1800 family)